MKKSILFIALIYLTAAFQSSLLATNPISAEALYEMSIKSNESAKTNIWIKAKTWVIKKLYKIGVGISIEHLSSIALIAGAVSLILLFVFIFAGLPWLILLAFSLALLGDILSILVLRKTKNSKSEFKKVRTKAWFGLIFSLLTGLLPLTLFGIILALLAAG